MISSYFDWHDIPSLLTSPWVLIFPKYVSKYSLPLDSSLIFTQTYYLSLCHLELCLEIMATSYRMYVYNTCTHVCTHTYKLVNRESTQSHSLTLRRISVLYGSRLVFFDEYKTRPCTCIDASTGCSSMKEPVHVDVTSPDSLNR